MNGDGKQDLVTANEGTGDIRVLLGDDAGGFGRAPGSPFGVGSIPVAATIGDLNGDGRPDLASANLASGDVTVLLNALTFAPLMHYCMTFGGTTSFENNSDFAAIDAPAPLACME